MKEEDLVIFTELTSLLISEGFEVYRSLPNLRNNGFIVYIKNSTEDKISNLKDFKNFIIHKVTYKIKSKSHVVEYLIDDERPVLEKDVVLKNQRVITPEERIFRGEEFNSLLLDLASKCLSIEASEDNGTEYIVTAKDSEGDERVKNLGNFKKFKIFKWVYDDETKTAKIYYEYKEEGL